MEKEKQFRNQKKDLKENEKEIKDTMNKILENMCIYGNILKNEIKEEK